MADSFKSTATKLIRHDANLWTYEGSLTMLYGIFRVPSRMTIIRLSNSNQLIVISPFPPTNTIKTLIAEIGVVQFIVIPNIHHTFWAVQFLQEYPDAYLVATYGAKCNKKLDTSIHAYFNGKDLVYNDCCSRIKSSFEWPINDIEFNCMYSSEFFYEVIFYHRPSSTMIITDLVFNYFEYDREQEIRANGHLFRFYLWLADGYREACCTKPFKLLFGKNIDLIKQDFDQLMIRYQGFDRLVMAHGTIIQQQGYEKLKQGTYQFVLDLYGKQKTQKQSYWSLRTKIGLVLIIGSSIFIVMRNLRQ